VTSTSTNHYAIQHVTSTTSTELLDTGDILINIKQLGEAI